MKGIRFPELFFYCEWHFLKMQDDEDYRIVQSLMDHAMMPAHRYLRFFYSFKGVLDMRSSLTHWSDVLTVGVAYAYLTTRTVIGSKRTYVSRKSLRNNFKTYFASPQTRRVYHVQFSVSLFSPTNHKRVISTEYRAYKMRRFSSSSLSHSRDSKLHRIVTAT